MADGFIKAGINRDKGDEGDVFRKTAILQLKDSYPLHPLHPC